MTEKTAGAGNKGLGFALAAGALVILGMLLGSCAISPGQQGSGGIATSTALPPAKTVSAGQAYQLYQQGAAFLDVREGGEWEAAHIPGATLLPLEELINRSSELPADLQLIIYCRTGERSAEAARFLQGAGFSDVSSLEGGLQEWIAAGYEVDSGK